MGGYGSGRKYGANCTDDFGRLIFDAGNETVIWSLDDALISSGHARARKSLLSVLKSKPDNYA